jgi:hypothetical protein
MNRRILGLTLCATGALWSVTVPAIAQSTTTPEAQPSTTMPEGSMPMDPTSPTTMPTQNPDGTTRTPMPGKPMADPTMQPQPPDATMAQPAPTQAPQAQASYPPCSRTLQDQCTNTRRGSDTKAGAPGTRKPRMNRPR